MTGKKQTEPNQVSAKCSPQKPERVFAHFSLEHGAVYHPSREVFFRALERGIAKKKTKPNNP